jgi:hypothetical protein
MATRTSVRKRLAELVEVMRLGSQAEGTSTPLDAQRRKNLERRLAKVLRRPVGTAFDDFELEIAKDEDWKKLTVLLCLAVAGSAPVTQRVGRGQSFGS